MSKGVEFLYYRDIYRRKESNLFISGSVNSIKNVSAAVVVERALHNC